ncbi:MAG: hypothetical protein MZV64_34510 [Ignavibacteriales bacterium]|nr:hypothetical protein [Ignavibacteriales bacterium]
MSRTFSKARRIHNSSALIMTSGTSFSRILTDRLRPGCAPVQSGLLLTA